MHIDQALAVVRADAARIQRYADRREDFLDSLDWTSLTSADIFESAMLDMLLEADLEDAKAHIGHLENIAAAGIHEVDSFQRFLPYPRPWHSQWNLLAN